MGWKKKWPCKRIHIRIPRTCGYYLIWPFPLKRKVFTDVIKLRILRWTDYPGSSGWALTSITCILIKREMRNFIYTETARTEKREIWKYWPWRWNSVRNVSSHQKLREARDRASPRISGKNNTADTLISAQWYQFQTSGF